MVPLSDARSAGRKGLSVALVVGVAAFAMFACTRSSATIGSGVTEEHVFAPLDAGEATPDADSGAGLCVVTTCPSPWATCPALDGTLPTYACGTDLSADIDHCGACNAACRNPSGAYNVHMACSSGQCQAFCNEHHADCNGIPDDGCESSVLDDADNCGSCGIRCPAGVACRGGKCGCPPGTTDCGGSCVDLSSDDANCGACGFACDEHQPADAGALFPHMTFRCAQGQCTSPRCVQNASEFWADCNLALDPDGCEVDLRHDTANCGKCGNACDPGQQCFAVGGATACQCKPGQTLCPGRPPLGDAFCADTENDPRNCGACGYVCPYVPNAKAVCTHGRCGSECLPGTADCNGRDDDGCEADLNKDPRHCGACGAMCDVGRGQPCVGGRCLTGDCDGAETK